MNEFLSEDDIKTFEGWLRYQAVDASTMTKEEVDQWRCSFEEVRKQRATRSKVGLMDLKCVEGEYKYAVAVREGTELWLVLWVRRNRKGEYFVLKPMNDKDWNPHTSYHHDGTLHLKSHGRKVLTPQKRQPLTGQFRGTEDLGINAGYAPKGVGAKCDPAAFSGVVEVPAGVQGPAHGVIAVALTEPGYPPPDHTRAYSIIIQRIFTETTPNIVISVMQHKDLPK